MWVNRKSDDRFTTGKKTAASRPAPRPEMLLFCDDGLCMNRKVNRQV
jgi:hypothetical protein